MVLTDDGKGIPESMSLADLSQKKHFGLVGISERVALLGGIMQFLPLAEGGAVLVVEIPNPYPALADEEEN